MNGCDSILTVVTSPWPQKSISNIYSSDVAQFKTSFTLVQCLSNWLKSRDCCGLDAPQSVKRCWEGLLWCWANTICFLCLCCFAGLVFCFYCSASIHLKEGKPPTTNRDVSSKAQHSLLLWCTLEYKVTNIRTQTLLLFVRWLVCQMLHCSGTERN